MTPHRKNNIACFAICAALVLLAGCQESDSTAKGSDSVDSVDSVDSTSSNDAKNDLKTAQHQIARSVGKTVARQSQSSTARPSGERDQFLAKKKSRKQPIPKNLSGKTTLVSGKQEPADIETPNVKRSSIKNSSEPNASKPQAGGSKASSLSEHEYEPPFGQRVNLFRPLDSESDETRRARRAGGPAIQLKGFAKIDQVKAILSLGGRVITLSEGEEKEGIRAIRIQPPEVQLQKNRRRWTLTLDKSLSSS